MNQCVCKRPSLFSPVLLKNNSSVGVSQVAERSGNRASNQKVADFIPGRAKLRCVVGQGTSPDLPRGNKSLWIRALLNG